jgi:hypothetical protein
MYSLVPVLQGFGPLASPPAILGVLVVLALIVFVGRFFMKVAWRLVVIALIVVGTLYVLGLLGFGFFA